MLKVKMVWRFHSLWLAASPIILASVLPRWYDEPNEPVLLPRQDVSAPDGCIVYCETDTCGASGGTCSIGRRQIAWDHFLTDAFHPLLTVSSRDLDELEVPIKPSVDKRVLLITPGGSLPRGGLARQTYVPRDVIPFLVNNVGPNGDPWDGPGSLTNFFAGDMATVTYQNEFGSRPFDLGTYGLHGCTMLTVISRRAVWMAHFWEGYAFKQSYDPSAPKIGPVRQDGDPENAAGTWAFQDRAIAALNGQPLVGPANKIYFPNSGPALDPDLFNDRTDNTVAYIMTPADQEPKGAKKTARTLRYNLQIGELETALKALIPGVKISNAKELSYVPLDLKEGSADLEQENNNDRGMILFQYDPDADGQGGHWCRLFHESYFVKNIQVN